MQDALNFHIFGCRQAERSGVDIDSEKIGRATATINTKQLKYSPRQDKTVTDHAF